MGYICEETKSEGYPMRLVANIPHPRVRIAIMSYMDKWLIEVEGGAYKQTYKISHEHIPSVEDVKKLVTEELIENTISRFNGMHVDFGKSFEQIKK